MGYPLPGEGGRGHEGRGKFQGSRKSRRQNLLAETSDVVLAGLNKHAILAFF